MPNCTISLFFLIIEVVESNWKVLDLPYQRHDNRTHRRSSYTGALVDEQSIADAIPHLTNLIPLTDKMSVSAILSCQAARPVLYSRLLIAVHVAGQLDGQRQRGPAPLPVGR